MTGQTIFCYCFLKRIDLLFDCGEPDSADQKPFSRARIVKIPSLSSAEQIILGDLKTFLTNRLGDKLVTFALYGSRVRGDYEEHSDIDVAIIVSGLTRDGKNKILDRVADLEMEHLIPLSTLVLSEETFEDLKARERRIAFDIEKDGIPL